MNGVVTCSCGSSLKPDCGQKAGQQRAKRVGRDATLDANEQFAEMWNDS